MILFVFIFNMGWNKNGNMLLYLFLLSGWLKIVKIHLSLLLVLLIFISFQLRFVKTVTTKNYKQWSLLLSTKCSSVSTTKALSFVT